MLENMKIVILSVACISGDESQILTAMEDSEIAQMGILCIELDVREATEKEKEFVKEQGPDYLYDEDDEDNE